MPRFLTIGFFLLASAGVCLLAQESVDDLFNDPDAGIIEETEEEGIQPEELTAATGPRFSGSVSTTAGASLGLMDWTNEPFASENIEPAAFYGLNSTLALDVRPSSASRFFMSVNVESPVGNSLTISQPGIGELFVDYTLAETVFFRAGRQSLTWGTGQLFNPGNIIRDISSSLSVRAFFPIASNGVTLIAIANDSYIQSGDGPLAGLLGYAGSFETSSDLATVALSAFYQITSGLTQSAYLKSSLGGVDLSLEAVNAWSPDWTYTDSDVLLSGFWEPGAWGTRVIAEYLLETARFSSGLGSSIAIGVAATDIPGFSWNPGIRWFHAFFDGSGELVLGVDGSVAPDVRLQIGLPINYGPSSGTYMQNKSDPADRVISLVAQLTLQLGW